jgi:hypothetical protein
MKTTFALLLSALLLVSCSRGTAPGASPGVSARTSSESTTEKGSPGYCSPRKHACAKYEKELRKKNGRSDKAAAYRVQCSEYNASCR